MDYQAQQPLGRGGRETAGATAWTGGGPTLPTTGQEPYPDVMRSRGARKRVPFLALFLAILFSVSSSLQAQQEQRRSRRPTEEQKKAAKLEEVASRLNRLTARSDVTPENLFLHEQITVLQERARVAPAGSYLLDRLESAMEDLLDASERIAPPESGRGDRGEPVGEEAQRRTARDLERTYFRLQQGDYFAGQAQESNAAQYVLTARRLYQQARVAYDAADYRRARRLAEAARQIISALESLAQAAVPLPQPPRLPEG